MMIRGGFNLAFDCIDYTPMLLMVHVRPERQPVFVQPHTFTLYPQIPFTTYVDGFGNICARLIAPPGRLSLWNRFVITDSGLPEVLPIYARQHPVAELPDDVMIYLLGSRYCDTQKLSDEAWRLFGGYAERWPRLQAIVQYAHDRMRFS